MGPLTIQQILRGELLVFREGNYLQGGPLPVISGVVTSRSRVITPFTPFIIPFIGGYIELLRTGKGSPCRGGHEPRKPFMRGPCHSIYNSYTPRPPIARIS